MIGPDIVRDLLKEGALDVMLAVFYEYPPTLEEWGLPDFASPNKHPLSWMALHALT